MIAKQLQFAAMSYCHCLFVSSLFWFIGIKIKNDWLKTQVVSGLTGEDIFQLRIVVPVFAAYFAPLTTLFSKEIVI